MYKLKNKCKKRNQNVRNHFKTLFQASPECNLKKMYTLKNLLIFSQ